MCGGVLGDVTQGIGNIARVAAPAAAITTGLPAVLSGGTDWGLGGALASNAASGGAAADSFGLGTSGDLAMQNLPAAPTLPAGTAPADLGMVNLPSISPETAAILGATGGLGAGTAGALGLAGGASGLGPTGIPLSSAGGGAAPAAAPGAAAVTPAGGAPGGAAATGGGAGVGAGAGSQSFVDNILGQLKKNALSLGLMGASLAGAGAVGQKPMPGQDTLTGLGNMSADVAKQYLAAAQSGNLTAPQQASLDQYAQQAKNQVRQYFESIGQGSSSARMQAEQQVDQTALAMKQQLLQQTLASGLQALGVAQGPLNTVAQYQLGQDQALQQALGRFATGAGLLAGTNAGGQTAEAAKTVAATQ